MPELLQRSTGRRISRFCGGLSTVEHVQARRGGVIRRRIARHAEPDVALSGHEGARAEQLLEESRKHGVQTLAEITRAALGRYLKAPGKRLFTAEERQSLADAIAATNASAELLGRARIRERQRQVEKHSDRSFEAFDSAPIKPLPPQKALDYFRRLEPKIGVDPERWGPQLERHAFTLAEDTEGIVLDKVKALIQKRLETGEGISSAPAEIDAILEEAGIAPSNPQYSEMIFRTNCLDAYNTGATEEMQADDVSESFPVWKYAAIVDGRQRPRHGDLNGKYFPNAVAFADVRGTDPGDICNCRCTFIPIFKADWEKLQSEGAQVESFVEKFSEPTAQILNLPDVRQERGWDCGAAAAMSVGQWYGVGPPTLKEWRAALGTNYAHGTNTTAIVAYLTSLGLEVEAHEGMTIDQLRAAWLAGKPTICPIQEWGDPAKQSLDVSGHYVVVLAVALGAVIVQDPSITNVEGTGSDSSPGRMLIPEATWLRVWHDRDDDGNTYRRFGIVVGRPVAAFCGGPGSGKPGPCPTGIKKELPKPPEQQPTEKAARAKAAHVLVDKEIQRYAEEHNEPHIAASLGGVSFPDSEPMDVAIAGNARDKAKWQAEADRWQAEKAAGKVPPDKMDTSGQLAHALEVKTMVKNGNDKLTMDTYAQVRKLQAEKERSGTFHTLVVDDRAVFNAKGPGKHDESKRRYFYRRGVAGSARIGSLHEAKDMNEVKRLMKMPEDKLPPGAQRTDGELRAGDWKPIQDAQGKGFKDRKTGRIVRAKK